MHCSTPGLPVHHQLPRSTQTHVHWVSDSIHPSHPVSSSSPPTLNLSQHQALFNKSALFIRWPKYWSFTFNISPSNEHPELISFRMDWLDLLAVQGTLKSLLQHYSSKASILRHSAASHIPKLGSPSPPLSLYLRALYSWPSSRSQLLWLYSRRLLEYMAMHWEEKTVYLWNFTLKIISLGIPFSTTIKYYKITFLNTKM